MRKNFFFEILYDLKKNLNIKYDCTCTWQYLAVIEDVIFAENIASKRDNWYRGCRDRLLKKK